MSESITPGIWAPRFRPVRAKSHDFEAQTTMGRGAEPGSM